MKELIELYVAFFKIGLFTLGGGSAIIPTVRKEAEDRGWMTNEDFLDSVGIINCMPGPIATNMSTFVGFKVRRTAGALISLAGVVSPSIVLVMLITFLFQSLINYPIVQYVFNGIRPAVVAIVLHAVWRLAKSAKLTEYFNWVFTILGFLCIAVLGLHPILVVVACALYGLFLRGFVVKAVDSHKKEGGVGV